MTMRHATRTLLLAVALSAGLLAGPTGAFAITKGEIITLAKLQISEDEIIAAIEKDRTIFNLTINDILELKNAGVPEKVIRFMLSTPQIFAAAPADTGTPPGDTVKAPDTTKPPEEKTPEEIRAEAERARLEALRLKQEQEKAMAAQQKAYAQGQLKTGMDYADRGRFVDAILHFQDFIQKNGYTPDTDEYYNARYGMALALVKSDLYESAANLLLEIVLQGPDKAFFQSAFGHLTEMRAKVAYSPPDLEQLTQFFVGNFSRQFQDEYAYFLGEFFYEGNNYSMALKYFEQVSSEAQVYAKARYLTGLVQVANQMYKSAVQSFQAAIEAQAQNRSELHVAHLAYLALARIAYETGNYDGAIYYYRKIPQSSTRLAEAFYEMGWTYFMKGDHSRTLGTFHALHSPFFTSYFYPELWILEATVYMNLCQYDKARDALEMFKRHVSSKGVPLAQFMQNMRTQAEYWMAYQKIANEDGGGYNLPIELLYPVMMNPDVYLLYRTIRQIEHEKALLTEARGRLGAWAEETMAMLEGQSISRINEIGIKIQMAFRMLQKDLRDYQVKVTEIELDLNQVEMEKIEASTKELLEEQMLQDAIAGILRLMQVGKTTEEIIEFIKSEPVYAKFKPVHISALEEKQVDRKIVRFLVDLTTVEEEKGGSPAIVGSDSLEWPFEGDYWEDEIWGYRSFLGEECK
ncbi:MAG: tetratricopeptide repeat protein [Deltaproteobacteria bacterium]|nr:tetratricopeptide repeat protein [Deltaproteobacteria bacterium]